MKKIFFLFTLLTLFSVSINSQSLAGGKVAGISDAPSNDYIIVSQPFKGITGASTWMHIDSFKTNFLAGQGSPQNLSSSEPTELTRQITISGGNSTTINVGRNDIVFQESEPSGNDTLKIWVKTSTNESYRRDSENQRWVKFQDKKIFEKKSEIYSLGFIDNERIVINGKDYIIKPDSISGINIDSVFVLPTGNSKYAIYNEPEISSEIFGVQSIWDTLLSCSFTQGSDTLTSSNPVFKSSHLNYVVYLKYLFSNAANFENSPNFQTTVANYSSLPVSPVSEGIYKVTDASDDTRRDTITGTQYYAFKNGGWVWLADFQDHTVSIIEYISPTKVRISYTPTKSGSNRQGYFGKNNKDEFEKFLRFTTSNNLHGYIQRGKIICKYPLVNGGSDDPIDLYYSGGYRSQISGFGRENTIMYLINEVDTNVNNGILTNDELVAHAPFDFRQDSQDFIDITFSDFSVIRNMHNGYKRTDARSGPLFYIKGARGSITVRNVYGYGGDGFVRNSRNGWLSIIDNCHYQGNNNGTELAFNQFGVGEGSLIVIKDTRIDNIGDIVTFSFNNKGRGISLYIRDESEMIIDRCHFYNVRDRLQFFSGGGSDRPDTLRVRQIIRNTVFEHEGDYGHGIVDVYGGRINRLFLSGNTHINKTDVRNTAIYLRGDTDILNCVVKGKTTTINNFNSNNNVFERAAIVNIDNCTFYEGQFDFFGQSATTCEWDIYIRNTTITPIRHTTGTQTIRFSAGTGSSLTRVYFQDSDFVGVDTAGNSGVFFENGANGYLEFKRCKFNFKNASGNHYLIKQFRGDSMQVRLIENESSGTVFGDLQSGLSGVGLSRIRGYGNNFNGWSIATGNDTVQTVKFDRFLDHFEYIENYDYYLPDSVYFTTPFKRYLIKSDTTNYSGLGNTKMKNDMFAIPVSEPKIYVGSHTGTTDLSGDISISITPSFSPSGGVFWVASNRSVSTRTITSTSISARIVLSSTGVAEASTSVNINYILFE